jgi:hypothetical protein
MVLTAIWIGSFLCSLIIVEIYVHIHRAGILVLLPEERLDCMKPLIFLYGAYIPVILAFWFLKPFSAPTSDAAADARFRIATICTIAFNGMVLILIAQNLFSTSPMPVLFNVKSAVAIAGWISFIVAPINAYYFGAKKT